MVSTSINENVLAKAELRGSLITLNINMKDKAEAENLVSEIANNYKDKWGINKGTIIEYTLADSNEKIKVKYNELKQKQSEESK